MGYRSEVVLVVGPEVMPQFLTTLAKCPEARDLCFKDADEMIKDYDSEKGSFLFQWSSIKWYEGYEVIDALTDFMDWCDGEEVESSLSNGDIVDAPAEDFYTFVRVGENSDDIVTRGCGHAVHPETRISY